MIYVVLTDHQDRQIHAGTVLQHEQLSKNMPPSDKCPRISKDLLPGGKFPIIVHRQIKWINARLYWLSSPI